MPSPNSTFHLWPARIFPLAAGVCLLASSQDALARKEAKPATEEESQTKTAFPTLDILPEGSILQKVKLPRYDKDFNPESLLKADKLTVLDNHRIKGENVTIELYGKNREVTAHAEMSHATYYQKDSSQKNSNKKESVIEAHESITLTGESFNASGNGLILHLEDKRGFLIGPATTEFVIPPSEPSTAMLLNSHNRPLNQSVVFASAVLTLTTSLIAEQPTKLTELTPAQITKLEELSKPTTEKLDQGAEETKEALSKEADMVKAADKTMKTFLTDNNQGHLLVKSEEPDTTPDNTPTTEKKSTTDTKDPDLVTVECAGGLYFDSKAGVMAYIKNVRLNGFIVDTKNDPPSKPRPFKLTCSDELKIFLEKPAEEVKDAGQTAETPPVDKAEKKEEEKSFADSFGKFQRVVATGKVNVTSTDDEGNQFTATAEVASYDAETKEMILRGGLPYVKYGPKQYLVCTAPGGYIHIDPDGKINAIGEFKMRINTSKMNSKSSDKKSTTP